jgi:hypothetical protein
LLHGESLCPTQDSRDADTLRALQDIAREVALAEQAKGMFGYEVLVLGR